MEKDGLIERKIFNQHPIRIEYHPTEKGRALKPLLDMMASYSLAYYTQQVKDGKKREISQIVHR